MSAKVVDASAVAAVLFGEPGADQVLGRLKGVQKIAPPWIGLELAIGVGFPLDELKIDYLSAHLGRMWTRLSVYDAQYLWLAEYLGIELVTLDERLARAARKA